MVIGVSIYTITLKNLVKPKGLTYPTSATQDFIRRVMVRVGWVA